MIENSEIEIRKACVDIGRKLTEAEKVARATDYGSEGEPLKKNVRMEAQKKKDREDEQSRMEDFRTTALINTGTTESEPLEIATYKW
jgi:DNA topoisomerase IA